MTLEFPTALFAFDEQEVDIERRVISGGVSLSGVEDLIATDGGGRVFVEFANGPLLDRETTMEWRAITALLDEGVTAIIVPFCDPLHQPYITGEESDLDFDEVPDNTVSADAALRATTIAFALVLPQELRGGQWFSIEHPTKGWRAYKIGEVTAQGDASATITFRPPLREAVTAGTVVEFRDPKCLMVQQGRASSRVELGRYGEASIRFVEAP